MNPSRNLPQFQLRFSSSELKDWFMQQSKINHRTLTAEINYHLEQAMLKQQQETGNVSQPTQTN